MKTVSGILVDRSRGVSPPATASPQAIVIRFISTPANAKCKSMENIGARTPTADLIRIPAGAHTGLVKKPGYQPWERKVTLTFGNDRTINAELEPSAQDPNNRISRQQ